MITFAAITFAGSTSCIAQSSSNSEDPFKRCTDSTIFVSPQFSDFGSDDIIIHPRRFKMTIPKTGRYTRPFNSSYSVIGFPKGQTILVALNHRASGPELTDSSFAVTQHYLVQRFGNLGLSGGEDKYFPKSGRKSEVFRRFGHEIMLLNIKPENFETFKDVIAPI